MSVALGEFAPTNALASNANPQAKTLQGGLIGATPGAVGMAMTAPLCYSPYTIGVCAVMMPIYALLTVAGGTLNASKEQSAGQMQVSAQQAINEAFKYENLQRGLLEHLLAYAGDHSRRSFKSIPDGTTPSATDDLLEIGIVNVDGIEARGGSWGFLSTHYAITLEARARLKRHTDGSVLMDRTYRYLSAPRTAEAWTQEGGKPLFEEMDQGYTVLSEWIIDDFFRGRHAEGNKAIPLPIEPPISHNILGTVTQSSVLAPTPSSSLTPTLRWSYDSAYFKPKAQEEDLHYEVQIFSTDKVGHYLWAVSPIYRKRHLSGTSHTVEDTLSPCTIYIWTVRAEADKEGETQVSEWSGNMLPALSDRIRLAHPKIDHKDLFGDNQRIILDQHIANYGFPFRTPCDNDAPQKKSQLGALFSPTASTPPHMEATPVTASTPPSAPTPPAPLKGEFQSKETKTSGLTGLVKGIEIRFSITNTSAQPITRFTGKIRFSDDTGREIGTLGINAMTRIPAGGSVSMTRTAVPVLFYGYTQLRDIPQEKLNAEFTFDTVEYGR